MRIEKTFLQWILCKKYRKPGNGAEHDAFKSYGSTECNKTIPLYFLLQILSHFKAFFQLNQQIEEEKRYHISFSD